MRIIISPAKKMNVDIDTLEPMGLPRFLPEAERLLKVLRAMSDQELKNLWKCNDSIAALNLRRVRRMDLYTQLTPAILSYEGIQYQYMAPGVFETHQFSFLEQHLRILSGFYGLLQPFDGVTPYRLEMQAKLSVDGCKDLYAFWGDKLAKALMEETDLVINLASKEYSRVIKPYLPSSVDFVTCTFGELKEGKVVEKGTLCKMARGQMVRWMAENKVTNIRELREFRDLGYQYAPQYSEGRHYVFLKEKEKGTKREETIW
nr:peroxide stress protein YaaA [uncultured Solibaculum sp.]